MLKLFKVLLEISIQIRTGVHPNSPQSAGGQNPGNAPPQHVQIGGNNTNVQNSPDKGGQNTTSAASQTQPRMLISFFLLSNFEDSEDNKKTDDKSENSKYSVIEEIVHSCLKYPKSNDTLHPSRYFSLLRLLFRAIGSASPHYRQDQDNIYHAFIPLLPGLLKELSILHVGFAKMSRKFSKGRKLAKNDLK